MEGGIQFEENFSWMVEEIEALDKYAFENRSRWVTSNEVEKEGIGRIIYAETPAEIYDQIDLDRERLTTVPELMMLRINAFEQLLKEVSGLRNILPLIVRKDKSVYKVLSAAREVIDSESHVYGIWQVRLTCGTHMVRARDEQENDTIFFYHETSFQNRINIANAFTGVLSDGGILYGESDLKILRSKTPPHARMKYSEYMEAKGGNFSGTDFLYHPIFSRSGGDENTMCRYVYALQVLSHLNYYHTAIHSGWRPGEMRENFGRHISLGSVGEAFYPPNNSTINHAALVIQNAIF